MMFIPTTAISVLVLSAPFDHLFYYIDDSGYHSGPLYMLLYFFFAMYLAISLIVCFFHKDSFKDRKAYGSAIIYNIILVIGLLVRYAFPKMLLMDTFCLLAIIIIYLSFVNPDFYLDRLTSAYNSLALKLYLREIHLRKNIKILAVTIRNYRELRDLYGSTQMDKAVVFMSNRLKTSFSKDKVFYMRDGKYLVLLENKSSTEQLSRYIHDILIKPFLSANSEIYLEAGSALLDIDYKVIPISTVMQLIYLSMDEAEKNLASDYPTVIDESYSNRIKRESEIKKSLSFALDHDSVEVFLQPIVDAKTGNLVGAEALSRIRDADGNLIPPDLFIPIAEQNGTINKLGEIVFKKVCLFINNMDITS
ncbi:MAG: EAL domain-containing protein, partial [Lachnospiraceae bacterium]|nr:EAL domain-containing protein [Lachnospiraceae bacterium]